jgi:uncharacterized protein YjiS (DUF1127 family)
MLPWMDLTFEPHTTLNTIRRTIKHYLGQMRQMSSRTQHVLLQLSNHQPHAVAIRDSAVMQEYYYY